MEIFFLYMSLWVASPCCLATLAFLQNNATLPSPFINYLSKGL